MYVSSRISAEGFLLAYVLVRYLGFNFLPLYPDILPRLVVAATVLAGKFHDDEFLPNKDFARVTLSSDPSV